MRTAASYTHAGPRIGLDAQRTWLRDGTPALIRPITSSDLELERRFAIGLSSQTRYLRLFSARPLLPGELERLVQIDPAREIALIAVVVIEGVEQQLGVARCIRDETDPSCCDFAIVIADAWQHLGLGEEILSRLMKSAVEAGIETFSGLMLSTNRAMLSLALKLGFSARIVPGDATVTRLEKRLPA